MRRVAHLSMAAARDSTNKAMRGHFPKCEKCGVPMRLWHQLLRVKEPDWVQAFSALAVNALPSYRKRNLAQVDGRLAGGPSFAFALSSHSFAIMAR
jgi:hypothetical protein